MVQVDIPAAVAFGQLLALLSKPYLKKEKNLFQNRLLGPLNFFFSVGFAPAGMFLMIAWPAWEVMYVTGWVESPYNQPWVAGFYVLFGISMVVIGNISFILAHKFYQIGKDNWVVIGTIIFFALMVLPFFLNWGVWLQVGTYAEVTKGGGYSFWDAPFFYGWAVIMSYLIIASVIACVWFYRKSKVLD